MVKKYLVPSCSNTSLNCGKVFFNFPKKMERRSVWFKTIGKEKVPKGVGYYYCCEDHFDLPTDAANWLKVQLLGDAVQLKSDVIPHRNLERILQEIENQPPTRKRKFQENISPRTSKEEEKEKKEVKKPAVSSFSITSSQSTLVISSSEDEDLLKEEEKVMLKKRAETTYAILENYSQFYLGLPKNIYVAVKFISSTANVNYRDVLICFKKIRLNDVNFRLGIDFGVSMCTVQKVFTTSVPKIAGVMQNFIFFPTPQQIKELLPIAFRYRFSETQFILDCFEIEIQKPSNPVLESHSWSEYKKCNTAKYFISSTPNGFINFVSAGFSGRITDTTIISSSNFLEKINNNVLMADRGFKNVETLLATRECKLIRPPSVGQGIQLDPAEAKFAKRVAALRIHVERLIGRVRNYDYSRYSFLY